MTNTATRYWCSLRDAAASGFTQFHSAGNGKPRLKRCKYCHGSLTLVTGLWGVFDWNGRNAYPLGEAIKTFSSPAAADRFAELEPTRVVRWISS